MRTVLNNTLYFIFKSPRFNIVILNSLFLLTSLQVAYFKPDYFNIPFFVKQAFTFKEKALILPINSAQKNFKTSTFAQLGYIAAKNATPKNTSTFLNKLKGEEKDIVASFSAVKTFRIPELQDINSFFYKEIISKKFNHPNNPKDLFGIFNSDHAIAKVKSYQQNTFSIIENSLIPEGYNSSRHSKKINFKNVSHSEEATLLKPYPPLIASWLEKVKLYDQIVLKEVLFTKAFENTMKDLKFLKVLSSQYDPETKDHVLRELSAEFFWTLEGNVGLENGKKPAFNPATGKFNQDSTYELYMPVADFFKAHKVLSCGPDDICDFIGKHL